MITTATLGKFDQYSWYFFLIWFLLAMVLNMAGIPAGHTLAYTGVVLILLNNVARLAIVAEQFRAVSNKRFRTLTYLLILISLGAVTVQYFLQREQ
jgi:uncharacterized membrane protein YhaH (DUF805 family)